MVEQAFVVLCTCPDRAVAEHLAQGLVAGKLAACVNIMPGIRSVYWWDGAVESSDEVLMMCKTTGERYPALERWLVNEHPYDVPEVVALPIEAGSDAYLDWIRKNV